MSIMLYCGIVTMYGFGPEVCMFVSPWQCARLCLLCIPIHTFNWSQQRRKLFYFCSLSRSYDRTWQSLCRNVYSTWGALKRELIPTLGRYTAASLIFYSIWIPLNGFNQNQTRCANAMLLSMQIAVSTTMYMVLPHPLPPRPQTSRSLLARDKLFPTCASYEFLKRHSQLPSASVTKHVTTSLPNLSNGTVSIVTQFSTQAFISNSLRSVYYSLLHV